MTRGYEGVIGRPVPLAPVPDWRSASGVGLRVPLRDRTGRPSPRRSRRPARRRVPSDPARRPPRHRKKQVGFASGRPPRRRGYGGSMRPGTVAPASVAPIVAGRRPSPRTPIMAIARFGIANPLILVDELEKSATRTDHGRLWELCCRAGDRDRLSIPRPRFPGRGRSGSRQLDRHRQCSGSVARPLRDRLRVLAMPAPQIRHLESLIAPVLAGSRRAAGWINACSQTSMARRSTWFGAVGRAARSGASAGSSRAVVMAREALSQRTDRPADEAASRGAAFQLP